MTAPVDGTNRVNPKAPRALYVHVPFCVGKCGYCDFYSVVRTDAGVRAYLDALGREMALTAAERPASFETIYIGGGTPTSLTAGELRELLDVVAPEDSFDERVEFTVEANPGTLDGEKMRVLASHGVNRLSLGAQSLDDRRLRTLGRRHAARDVPAALDAAREAGLVNLSLDLIFAIPGQTSDDWARDLDRVLALDVPHLSTYALTWEEHTPMGEALARGRIARASEDDELAMYERAIDFLSAAGYEHYEISNFARPGFRCRHNDVYWANEAYLGFGPSAVSYLGGERRRNVASVEEYAAVLAAGRSPVDFREQLSEEKRARETAVMNLRRRRGIDLAEFARHTGFDARTLFAGEFERMSEFGLIELDDASVRLSRRGLFVADTVLSELV